MTDEKLQAWLDGELRPEEAEAVAREVAADPQLAALAEKHRRLSARVRAAFDPIAEAPVPDRLIGMIGRSNVVEIAEVRMHRSSLMRPLSAQWAAMAATLVVGVLMGTLIGRENSSPIAVNDGQLVTEAGLGKALDQQLAISGERDGIRTGVSFRDRTGSYCRSFSTKSAAGLACRAGDDWAIRGLFGTSPEADSGYRMAAGVPPQLAQMIDETIAGEPLDEAQEQAARAAGWR